MAAPRKKSPSASAGASAPIPAADGRLHAIHGDDDFLVAEEGRRVIAQLTPKGASEFGLEIIEGAATNQGEAAAIFGKLFEALQAQSFFATEKVVWWRDTNLLGASTTASAADTSSFLAALDEQIRKGLPPGVALVITASDWDGRKSITKTLQKAGRVVEFKKDPYRQEENQARAAAFAREHATQLGKQLGDEAALLLAVMSDGDSRTMLGELEKISAYVGDRPAITEEDIRAIGSTRPGGVIWSLGDALGERKLGPCRDLLEGLLFGGEKPVGLLFTLISRVRLLLLLRSLVDQKLVSPGANYSSFKTQMERLPAALTESLPKDRKLNPLLTHPFVLHKALPGAARYTQAELLGAMQTLLEANEKLFSTGSDPKAVLDEAILHICMKP